MDLVSFDVPGEFELIRKILSKDNVESVYSSGRKCNFKGCEGDHLQPINIKGWFWPGAGNSQIPPTDIAHQDTAWSSKGALGKSQPDNYEGLKHGKIKVEGDKGVTIEGLQEYYDEACLAVLNNKYQDGIKWHDVACYIRSAIICEDSNQLIQLVEREEGVRVRNWTSPAENPVDLNIFKSVTENPADFNIFNPDLVDSDLNSVAESTTKGNANLSGWNTKSVEKAETIKTKTKLESTTKASQWFDWFGTSKTTVTTRKPTTSTSGWYIKSTTSEERTATTSGWYIQSGLKTTKNAAKVGETTTKEAESYWSNWYFGK